MDGGISRQPPAYSLLNVYLDALNNVLLAQLFFSKVKLIS